MAVGVEGEFTLSSIFKSSETSDSGPILGKMGDFSSFWLIFIKPPVADRVSRSVTMVVSARDPLGGCDSKTAPDFVLFLCPLLAGLGDDLAAVTGIGNCKMTSLSVVGLVWTRVASFVGLKMLGEGVLVDIWVEMSDILIFSCF